MNLAWYYASVIAAAQYIAFTYMRQEIQITAGLTKSSKRRGPKLVFHRDGEQAKP